MPFKRKETVTSVPTHLRWIVKNPENVGKEFEIVTILLNQEWKTITFFTSDFKFNLKAESIEEFLETKDDLYKSLKRGYCKASLKDETNLEEKQYTCSINIDSIPESKGGRGYELGKNRISIKASEAKE